MFSAWLCIYRLSQLESAGRTLKITEARLEDSGKFTCLATNAAGEAQQHIRLSVHGNFLIDSQTLSQPVCLTYLLVVCNTVCVPQNLPVSRPLGRPWTRPFCRAFPLSLSARPRAVRYPVKLFCTSSVPLCAPTQCSLPANSFSFFLLSFQLDELNTKSLDR